MKNARRVRVDEPRASSVVEFGAIDRSIARCFERAVFVRRRVTRVEAASGRRGPPRSIECAAGPTLLTFTNSCMREIRRIEGAEPYMDAPTAWVIRFARADATANVRVASSTVRARSSERVVRVGRERSRRRVASRRVVLARRSSKRSSDPASARGVG